MADNRLPLMISVVGTSGSGKTSTIEYLTAHLTRLGFRVGVAKHIHREGFTMDTKGKDTWRHARAGASVVVGVSPNEFAIIKRTPSESEFKNVAEALRAQELDLALLEGFSTALAEKRKHYKIVTAKNDRDLQYTLKRTPPPILAIAGPIARGFKGKRNSLTVNIQREGPILTSIIRRLLRPKELEEMWKRASLRHGGACVGLAIGVRAAYLSSSAFGQNSSSPSAITCETKDCVAEAFRVSYPKSHVRIGTVRNDRIAIRSHGAKLMIGLTRKKFSSARQVLKVPEKELFEYVSLLNDTAF